MQNWKIFLLLGAAVLIGQTLPTLNQIRPTAGPATSLVVTINGKGYWADLGPGLDVKLETTGRATIRAVATERQVWDTIPTVAWETPRTCATYPVDARNLRVYLNGIRVALGVDFVAAGTGKLCFIEHYGNMVAEGDNKGQVRVDYTVSP